LNWGAQATPDPPVQSRPLCFPFSFPFSSSAAASLLARRTVSFTVCLRSRAKHLPGFDAAFPIVRLSRFPSLKRTTTSTMEWEMLQTDFLYIGMLLVCGLSMWAFIALCSRLERQEGEKK
jgi:hypothetical protein